MVAGEEGDLLRVLEDVLAVGVAVAQPAEELDQLRVHARDLELEEGRVPLLLDALLELRLDLLDDLLDARRVDAAVGDQPLEGDAGDLAPEGVEAGEDHRLRRVVDDQVDAGRHLEGADVAPLAADDPPLHLVVRQLDHRDRRLRDVVRGQPLDGEADDPLRLAVALLARLVLDPLDEVRGVDPRLVLESARPAHPWPAARSGRRSARAACAARRPAGRASLSLRRDLLLARRPALRSRPTELLVALVELARAACRGCLPSGSGGARASRARRGACARRSRTRSAPGAASPWPRARASRSFGFALPARLLAHAGGFALGLGERASAGAGESATSRRPARRP